MNRVLFLLLGTFIFSMVQGQNNPVTIKGNASDYAGYNIELYQLADPFSEEKNLVSSFEIKADGSFQTEFQLEKTIFCQADFDAWQAEIYLEPGKSYNIVFPPLNKVSDLQKRNPFFNAETVSFGLIDAPETDLNRMIQTFEQSYTEQENYFFNKIYLTKSQSAVDSLKNRMEQKFPVSDNRYFEDYKFYRLGSAEYALHQGRNDSFIETYFVKKAPNLQLQPYKQLFEQLFTNYFSVTGNSIGGDAFKRLVGQADLSGIETYFITTKNWSPNLTHLVILASINDAFYQGQFGKNSLLRLLDKISQSSWPKSEKQIASALKEKLTYLLPNSVAPQLSYTDFDGKKHTLSELAGKYVYLHFTSVSNPICRQHLDYIKSSMQSILQNVTFVHLIPESEASKKELILQQDWPGNFYIVSESETDKYNVKTYPSAYLISPEGILILAPAQNPMDGFGSQFSSILKQKRIDELKNQSK